MGAGVPVEGNELSLAEYARSFPVWYHTQDLGQGVVTPGFYDHRPVLDRFPIPKDLTGTRCLDVGTMDGFWAFEMERRGAAEVVAVDLDDPDALDWPALIKPTVTKTLDETKAERFEFVRSVFDSKVTRVVRSIYDLDTDMGLFDVVFCGDLLLHLKDPISALEAIRRVTRGRAIICTLIMKTPFFVRQPLVRFDGIDEFTWWVPNQQALVRMMTASGFDQVELAPLFDLPLTTDKRWKGHRGVVTGYTSPSR
jgi:tRNA (mo5U34)-methyltransferase